MSASSNPFAALLAPLDNLFVTSPFGTRGGILHPGIDYRAPIGTQVYSAAAGTVTFAGVQSGYGDVVIIDHGGGVTTKYAHLSEIDVTAGQAVGASDPLGLSGDTGNATGPHLHFELDVNGVPVDPSSSIMGASLANVIPAATSPGVVEDDSVDTGIPDTSGSIDLSTLFDNVDPVMLAVAAVFIGGVMAFSSGGDS